MKGQNAARHLTTDYIHAYDNNRNIDLPKYPLAVCQCVPPEWGWEGLDKSDITLATILKKQGYKTIHIGKAHFAPDKHEGTDPLNLGFDVNIGGCAIGRPNSYYGEECYGKGTEVAVPHLEEYHNTKTFLTEALTLEAKKEIVKASEEKKPFYLYMSHYAVHSPFNSDPRFADNYVDSDKNKPSQAYATLIEGMDKSLGDILNQIQEMGIAENTLIFFLGDNGGDCPGGLENISTNAPLRGRKGSKFEGGVRVPFIAAWGESNIENTWQKKLPIVAGSIRQEIGSCYDLLPTIANIIEAPLPEELIVDGQVLSPLLMGQTIEGHKDEFLNHYPHPRGGKSNFFTTYRKGNWKVRYEYFAKEDERYALYNLATDISESKNLVDQHPQKLKTMMQALVDKLESMNAVYPIKDGQRFDPIIP